MMKEEVRSMLDANIPGKRSRGRPNQRWKYAYKRDITEDNTTNRAEWRKEINMGDPR